MNRWAALLLALAAVGEGRAATAYVTDELVLGVYATQNTQGERLATLHSGAIVETLAVSGDSTQVSLSDGVTGWVKTAYLTTSPPATVRIKRVQEELDRQLATAPGIAEAAERSEVERLTRLVADQGANGQRAITDPRDAPAPTGSPVWPWIVAIVAALGGGFWLGYATLARRIKTKFGGIKVY